MRPRILGVIPARFASTRFPGKVLAQIAGKSILQCVYERSSASSYLSSVVIATDDERIRDEARRFGAPVQMTRSDHRSGTDRVAEVASSANVDIVVNVQGDEPLIEPAAIDSAIVALLDDAGAPMATLKKRIELPREIADPNVVKVVTDARQRAVYFSRSPIPFDTGNEAVHFKHIGLYVYRSEFLLSYPALPVGPLEAAERLEQLRALENGFPIRVEETEHESIGVDTPEDLDQVRNLFEMSGMAT